MKKAFVVSLVLSAGLLLCACGNDSNQTLMEKYSLAESGSWTDGSYTETASGKKGDFTVTVTIEDGKLTAVSVGENSETPGKGDKAIESIPDAIVDAQSPDVDAVAGATVTSDAIKEAVAKCLEQAS